MLEADGIGVEGRFKGDGALPGEFGGAAVVNRLRGHQSDAGMVMQHVEPAWLQRYGDLVRYKTPISFDEYNGALQRWFRVNANWIQDKRFLAIFTDITAIKLAEVALATSQAEKRAAAYVRAQERLDDSKQEALSLGTHIVNRLSPRTPWGKYSLAVSFLVLALAIRFFFLPVTGAPFVTFYPAIVISAFLCGTGAGLLVAILSAVLGAHFFIAPHWSLVIAPENLTTMATFAVSALLICLIIDTMLRGVVTANTIAKRLGRTTIALQKDLVERKALEASMASSDAVIRSSSDAIISKSLDGVVTSWNQGATAMFGYSAAEMLGQKMVMLFPKDRAGEEDLILARIQEGETLVQSDTIRMHKSGRAVDVSVAISPIFDDDRKIVGAATVARDITLRKQAARLLHESEVRFQAAIGSLREGVAIHNADGDIVYRNASMGRFFGLSVEQRYGLADVDIRWHAIREDGSDFPRKTRPGVQALRHGIPQNDVIMGIYKLSGELTWLSVNAIPLGPTDKRDGVIVTAVDITEHKRGEDALRASNVALRKSTLIAETASQAKSAFLSSMSHELRTPLNAVLGFTQLLAAGEPPPSASQVQSIEHILKAGWHLLKMIDAILDLSTIESGGVSISREPVLLAIAVRESLAMYEAPAHERAIRMTFAEPDESIHVHADNTRLRQVLTKLLGNAIKYNRVGGTVDVQCILIGSSQVRISVRDSGDGLAPEQVAQLFQPFNRLGRESGSIEGSGIGLALTRRLVELMGGTIGVESTPGVGSHFWIDLELASAPMLTRNVPALGAQPLNPEAPDASIRRPTLLYVEDNPANLMLVEGIIARRGDLQLMTAVDGYAGVRIAHAVQPDVILMDINLPGLNGVDALKLLREDRETAHIPVVAISANVGPRDIKRALEAGFFRYLTKPIKIDEFMETLDLALRHAAGNAIEKNEKVTLP